MSSPTQRSLAYYRRRGWTAAVTERWNPHAKIRQDLWGWCDILCFRGDRRGVLGVQTTSDNGGTMAGRVKKLLANPTLREFLLAGNAAEVHGWRKAATGRWKVRRRVITLEDFTEAES